jgi:hypothetical protein
MVQISLSKRSIVLASVAVVAVIALVLIVRGLHNGGSQRTETTVSSAAKPKPTAQPAHKQTQPAKAKAQTPAKKHVVAHKQTPATPKVVKYKLTWHAKGPGTVRVVEQRTGRVLSQPVWLEEGTKVTLTAQKSDNSWFAGWYRSCIKFHDQTVCPLTLSHHNKDVSAVFKAIPVKPAPAPVPTYHPPAPSYSPPVHTYTPPSTSSNTNSSNTTVHVTPTASKPVLTHNAHQAPVTTKPTTPATSKPTPTSSPAKAANSTAHPAHPATTTRVQPDPPPKVTKAVKSPKPDKPPVKSTDSDDDQALLPPPPSNSPRPAPATNTVPTVPAATTSTPVVPAQPATVAPDGNGG